MEGAGDDELWKRKIDIAGWFSMSINIVPIRVIIVPIRVIVFYYSSCRCLASKVVGYRCDGSPLTLPIPPPTPPSCKAPPISHVHPPSFVLSSLFPSFLPPAHAGSCTI
jgi:hypothetical protein